MITVSFTHDALEQYPTEAKISDITFKDNGSYVDFDKGDAVFINEVDVTTLGVVVGQIASVVNAAHPSGTYVLIVKRDVVQTERTPTPNPRNSRRASPAPGFVISN